MDSTGLISGLSGANAYSDLGSPSQAPVTTPAASQFAGSPKSDALAPSVAVAPSPTPEAIVAGTKDLPVNVRYAPSAPPRDVGFDRSA